jgi:hypothetical protein
LHASAAGLWEEVAEIERGDLRKPRNWESYEKSVADAQQRRRRDHGIAQAIARRSDKASERMKLREWLWILLEKLGKNQAVVYNLKVTNDQAIVGR